VGLCLQYDDLPCGSIEEGLAAAAGGAREEVLWRNKPAWAAICVLALFPDEALVEVQVRGYHPGSRFKWDS
jgi:hypothetical protein